MSSCRSKVESRRSKVESQEIGGQGSVVSDQNDAPNPQRSAFSVQPSEQASSVKRQASILYGWCFLGLALLMLGLAACSSAPTATKTPPVPTARVVSPPPVLPTQPLLLPTPTAGGVSAPPPGVPDLAYGGANVKLNINYSDVFGGAAFNDRDTQVVFMTPDAPDKVLSYYTAQFMKLGFPQPDRYQDGSNFVLASQSTNDTIQVVVDSTDTILKQPNLLPAVQQQLQAGQTLVITIYRQKSGLPRALLTPTLKP